MRQTGFSDSTIRYKQLHGGDVAAVASLLNMDPDKIIDFSVNVNYLGPPKPVEDCAKKEVPLDRYPEVDGRGLIEALSEHWGLDRECFIIGNGGAELIYWLCAFYHPQKVLVIDPGFSDYRAAAAANGACLVGRLLDREREFRLDPDLFVQHVGTVDAVILGRPNNPTGNLIDRQLLIKSIAKHPNVVFMVDESFIDFVDDPGASLFSETGRLPNLHVLRSMTKMYAIPEIRLGYVAAHKGAAGRLSRARPPWALSSRQIEVAKVALSQQKFVEFSRLQIGRSRHELLRKLRKISWLRPFDSRVNFVLVEIIGDGINGAELMLRLAEKGFLIRDCASFTGLNDKYFRLAVRSVAENDKLVEELKGVCGWRT